MRYPHILYALRTKVSTVGAIHELPLLWKELPCGKLSPPNYSRSPTGNLIENSIQPSLLATQI
jgi:hypothetical protein